MGFHQIITKQTQKKREKNNEASYCHFTVAWSLFGQSPMKTYRKSLLIMSSGYKIPSIS
jgi:hypothetical protein